MNLASLKELFPAIKNSIHIYDDRDYMPLPLSDEPIESCVHIA